MKEEREKKETTLQTMHRIIQSKCEAILFSKTNTVGHLSAWAFFCFVSF